MCRVCHGVCIARLLRTKRRDSPPGRAQTTWRKQAVGASIPKQPFLAGFLSTVALPEVTKSSWRLGFVVKDSLWVAFCNDVYFVHN